MTRSLDLMRATPPRGSGAPKRALELRRAGRRRKVWVLLAQMLLIAAAIACVRVSNPLGWTSGVISDGILYVGTMEGGVTAVHIDTEPGDTPNTLWSCQLGDEESPPTFYGTPAVFGEALYLAGYSGKLYSISIAPGDVPCFDRLLLDESVGQGGDPIVGGPVVAGGVVLIGSSDGNLYALDVEDGFPKWQFETGNKVWSSPVVAGEVVYISSLDGNLYALNLNSGSELWRFEAGGAIASKPVLANGNLHFGAFDSVFYAVDASSGRKRWDFTGAKGWFWGEAVVSGDAVYAPSLDGNVYALDVATGDIRWAYQTESPIVGAPVLVGENLAVPSQSEGVFLLRARDGEFQDRCKVDGALRAPLTLHEDVIYLTADDHSVRSVEVNRDRNLVEGWEHITDSEDGRYGRWKCG